MVTDDRPNLTLSKESSSYVSSISPQDLLKDTNLLSPKARGVYILVIELSKPVNLHIRSLGTCTLHEGFYLYIGSALGKGPSGLRGRILRHLGFRRRSLYWHIDKLLAIKDVKLRAIVLAHCSKRYECILAKAIANHDLFEYGPKGFGSSDCHCPTHLMKSRIQQLPGILLSLRALVIKLGLSPQVFILK